MLKAFAREKTVLLKMPAVHVLLISQDFSIQGGQIGRRIFVQIGVAGSSRIALQHDNVYSTSVMKPVKELVSRPVSAHLDICPTCARIVARQG